jgi:hypothetical protein
MSITTRFPKIPKEQITPLVAELLELIQLQMDEIQFLRDEIARLKGRNPDRTSSHPVSKILQEKAAPKKEKKAS